MGIVEALVLGLTIVCIAGGLATVFTADDSKTAWAGAFLLVVGLGIGFVGGRHYPDHVVNDDGWQNCSIDGVFVQLWDQPQVDCQSIYVEVIGK